MIKTLNSSEFGRYLMPSHGKTAQSVTDVVTKIIENVSENGDDAVLNYCEEFDKVRPRPLYVTHDEIKQACAEAGEAFLGVLERAKANIERYHKMQIRNGYEIKEPGITLGMRVLPIERVGLYVPGGTAAYPSSVLMNAIPARIAGVSEVIMCTPPSEDGSIKPDILAAAYVAGVDKIFKVGGAQAIAAMAYGTQSIPKVDKIVGPGNIFVAEAKRQVYGTVDIDMIAGPSEILIIADGYGDPEIIAADLLSQAEHDKNSSAILITDSKELAGKVSEELEIQIPKLPRSNIARASVDNNGRIVLVGSIIEAVTLSNSVAPEHLELCVENPFDYLPLVKAAGSVFLGRHTPEALGDYCAGTNHVLPTGGTARFFSPLSVDDFVKKSCYTCFDEQALGALANDIMTFAKREGLDAHAESVRKRVDK